MSNLSPDDSARKGRAYLAANPHHKIFPVKAGKKFPPLVQDPYGAGASDDPAQIDAWAEKHSGRNNWGVALAPSNLIVVDVDTKAGKFGETTYDWLDLDHGWPPTRTVTTPSGGRHQYYSGRHIFALGKNGFGLDIDSPHYVLIPGSVVDGVGSYELANDLPIVTAPSWFYEVITAARAKLPNAGEAVIDLDQPKNIEWAQDYLENDAEPAIQGKNGDHTTFRVACSVKDAGISQALAVELMLERFNERCDPPWTREEMETKVANAYAYASQSHAGGKTAEADFTSDGDEVDPHDIKVKGKPENIEKAARHRREARQLEAARPPEERDRVWTLPEVKDEIVWVAGPKRFYVRTDPDTKFDKDAFNDKFRYLAGKKGDRNLSDQLFKLAKGTIRKPNRIVYKPLAPEFSNGVWNQWTPSPVIAVEGDTTLWDSHLVYLFPDKASRDHVLNWLAGVLQRLDVKPMHALLIIGENQGTGKSFITGVLAQLVGKRNWRSLAQDDLANSFTGWATHTKVVSVEELRAVSKTELAKKLHPWITQVDMEVNEKNLPTFRMEQVIAFLFNSNKADAIAVDNTDRRYLVVETKATPRPEGSAYYTKLYGLLNDPVALGAILHQLMTRDLGDYDVQGRAPDTAAKAAMKAEGANEVAQWMAQNDGLPPFCYRTLTIDEVLKHLPNAIRGSVHSIKEAMRHRGGVCWPKQIQPSGRNGDKPRVWLFGEAAERANADNLDSAEVLRMYREDRDESRHMPPVHEPEDLELNDAEEFRGAILEFFLDPYQGQPTDAPASAVGPG